MHSGPFGCLTKVGAKRAELVQKFVPRSRVGIFLNERTRSTPLDPKMKFWCVLYHLGAFGAVCRVGIFCNEGTRSTPLDPKLIFWCISYHLGAFGMFGCLTKVGAKRAELVQKFVPRSRVGIFLNERTRSTPLDPKMMFWCVLYHLGAFGAVCRVGIFCNEGTRSTPFDPKLIFWCISYHLGAFGTFGCLMKLGAKRAELVQKFVPRSRVGIFQIGRAH